MMRSLLTDRPDDTTRTLIKALTAASFLLGLSEMILPKRVAELAGIDDTPRAQQVIRIFGIRECGSGAALIAGPPALVWTRVAGDALDLGLLLAALNNLSGRRRRRCATAAIAIAGITAIDVFTARRT